MKLARFHRLRRLLLLVCLLALTVTVGAQLHVSILTCSPGPEVYARYGHTAIRLWSDSVNDWGERLDVVYHYGVFDSEEPHFLHHFVRGETDYRIGAAPTDAFLESYAEDGRAVYEQELQLTESQKQAMMRALEENYRPENRYYRYNFIYDNCATRPYRLLCRALEDSLRSPRFDQRRSTFRQAVRHYSGGANDWAQLGIDLCFGWEADRVMTPDERMFLPEELQDRLSEATFQGHPIVLHDGARPFQVERQCPFLLSPAFLLFLLVLAVLALCWYDWRRLHRLDFVLDRLLYLTWALSGTILCYLAIWSDHPFVHRNLNLLLLNPMWFLPFGLSCFYAGRQYLRYNQDKVLIYAVIVLLIVLFGPQRCGMFVVTSLVILILRALLSIYLCADGYEWFMRGRHRRNYLALLAALLVPAGMQAEPRLIVTAVVDGLNQSVLDRIERHWNGGGFQTLEQGIHYGAAYYPQLVNGDVETVVTWLTGDTPSESGIAGGTRFDRATHKVVPVFEDKTQIGIGTSQHLSPKSMRTLTLADEFQLQNKPGRVLAIGLDGPETIALAGHSALAATWLDGQKYQWVASGYYNEGLPQEAADENRDSVLWRLSQEIWGPAQDSITMYESPSERELLDHGFSYRPQYVAGSTTHPSLNRTPLANQAVLDLALQMQVRRHLGEEGSDMLCLQLTVKTPSVASDFLASAEQEDMYLRLDRQLQQFMQQLDERLGHGGYVMVVAGRPVQGLSLGQWKQARLGGGVFDVDRCRALLNLYLMAKYGHENWVEGVHGYQIYLNEHLMEQHKLPIADVEEDVARFMTEFDGVEAAYPGSRILQIVAEKEGDLTPMQLKNSYSKQWGGDVVYCLKPGWQVSNADGSIYDTVLEQNPTVPCFIAGGDIHQEELRTAQSIQEVHREVKRQLFIP